jgi:hypothetical protein
LRRSPNEHHSFGIVELLLFFIFFELFFVIEPFSIFPGAPFCMLSDCGAGPVVNITQRRSTPPVPRPHEQKTNPAGGQHQRH